LRCIAIAAPAGENFMHKLSDGVRPEPAEICNRTGNSEDRQREPRSPRSGQIEWRVARTWARHPVVESYVADDKIYCVYLAENEGMVRKHAEMSGFPASKVSEIRKTIDPTTERSDELTPHPVQLRTRVEQPF
jgi:hypothetical protein